MQGTNVGIEMWPAGYIDQLQGFDAVWFSSRKSICTELMKDFIRKKGWTGLRFIPFGEFIERDPAAEV